MNLRLLLSLCLLIIAKAALLQSVSLEAAENAKRPNILFIYSDDQTHRTVSCYPEAYKWAKTPNIDALAKNGIRFAHAGIGTWCMPSRAALLTGHHQYGVNSMRMEGKYPGSAYDPKQCPFWPSVFRKEGYTTAQIGKWHTGVDTGANRDWDYQLVWNRPRYPENAGAYYENQLIEKNGAKPVMTPGYTTDNYTKWAQEFINGKHRDAEKPWYLWVCYGAVHGPFTPAKRHLENYPNPDVPTPKDIYPPRAGKPAYMQKVNAWEMGPDGKPYMRGGGFAARTVDTKGIHGNSLQDWVRQYHQGVVAIDEGIGKLIQTLKDSGQLENTLVVYTSDQGFAWGQHGFRMKLAPYDATIRSPMVISMPGTLPQGKVCETPVAGVDLIPTFFNFAGIDLPWKMHGHDLTPLLKNPDAKWDHVALQAFTARSYGQDTHKVPRDNPEKLYLNGIPWWLSIRQGDYKYIRTLVEGEIEELYDLKTDPEELHNLALKKEHAATLKKFRTTLIKELKRTDAKMVDDLPQVTTAFE